MTHSTLPVSAVGVVGHKNMEEAMKRAGIQMNPRELKLLWEFCSKDDHPHFSYAILTRLSLLECQMTLRRYRMRRKARRGLTLSGFLMGN